MSAVEALATPTLGIVLMLSIDCGSVSSVGAQAYICNRGGGPNSSIELKVQF
jgi:hypothetical protein